MNDAPAKPYDEKLAAILQQHLHIMVLGLCTELRQFPPHQMMPALAAAMGGVMSQASQFEDMGVTLRSREAIKKVFEAALRTHAPAIQRFTPDVNRKAS